MHMICKENLNDAELDIDEIVQPTMVITANGEVQTHEEATVYVKELDYIHFTSDHKMYNPFRHCFGASVLNRGSTFVARTSSFEHTWTT